MRWVITADTEKALLNKTNEKAGSIAFLCEKFPDPSWTRINGKLPIHLATRSGAPTGAIEALVNAYPEGCKMFEEGDDEEGRSQNLPLHNATLKRAVDGVVEKLLEANPEASRVANAVGYLPIHYAAEKKCTPACMKMLTNVHADGARSKNSDQLVPLQLAAAYQADDEVVGELLRVYPEATRLKSEEGKYPARVAFECAASDGVIDQLLVAFPEAAQEKDELGKVLLHYAAEKQASDAKVRSMLTAYVQGAQVKSPGGGLPLHYASQFNASDVVAELITSAYPEATRERRRRGQPAAPPRVPVPGDGGLRLDADRGVPRDAAPTPGNGSLPLHYAAAHESADEVVKVLLTAHREACRTKDAAGNLPLHLAYAKSIQLARVEKEKLNDRKVAEITQAKWHADGVDAQKFKMQIKEVDEFADAKTKVHEGGGRGGRGERGGDEDAAPVHLRDGGRRRLRQRARSASRRPPSPAACSSASRRSCRSTSGWRSSRRRGRTTPARQGDRPLRQPAAPRGRQEGERGGHRGCPRVQQGRGQGPDGGGADAAAPPRHTEQGARRRRAPPPLPVPRGCRVHESHEERLPLHFACEKEASDAVVSALLTAHFEASRMATTKGYLPLHIAAERDTTAFVLNALLMAAPDSPKAPRPTAACRSTAPSSIRRSWASSARCSRRTPPPRRPRTCAAACPSAGRRASSRPRTSSRRCSRAHPEAANTADSEARLPLHAAVEYEASDAVVHMLVDRCPQACRAVNLQKKRPIDLAYEHGASYQIVERLEQGATVARNEEVPLLAWLWG